MSLSISIIPKAKDFDISRLKKEIEKPNNDLFGFENTRQSLWGHPIMNKLSCKLIYSLRNKNIYAFDQSILELKGEFETILDNISTISSETGYDVEFIQFRINNALEAIRIIGNNFDTVGIAIE